MMTLDTIDNATRAAFKHRYRDRPWHTFDTQPFPVQCRWTQVVAKVLNGAITDGRGFRREYLRGFSGTESLKEWTQLSARERHDWQAVYDAASRIGATAERLAA